MPTPPLKDSLAHEAVAAVEEHGSKAAAARALNIPEATFKHRIRVAQERGITAESAPPPETPDFPPSDIPFEERRELQGKAFKVADESMRAHEWFTLKYKTNEPIGYACIGDIHGDDDGHNVEQFDRDMRLIEKTDGVEVVVMGDLINNWPSGSRLTSKWADQMMRRKDSKNFIRWLLDTVSVRILLLGNHDEFSEDMPCFIDEVARDKDIIVHKWSAKWRAVFPNGRKCYVWVAHSFKGRSMYHNLQGMIRAFLECPAHFVVGAHLHMHEYQRKEAPKIAHLVNEGLSFIAHLAMVRGYKFSHGDYYAVSNDFADYREGASGLCIINPDAETGGKFTEYFPDLEAGCDRLRELRKKWQAQQRKRG